MIDHIIKIDGKWYIDLEHHEEKEKELIKENKQLRDKLEDCEAKGMTEYGIRNMFEQRINKAIEILKDTSVDMPSTLLIETIDYARHILGDKDND